MHWFFPGATVVSSPGHYALFGIPGGTYRLRVSKNGYVTQEIETRKDSPTPRCRPLFRSNCPL